MSHKIAKLARLQTRLNWLNPKEIDNEEPANPTDRTFTLHSQCGRLYNKVMKRTFKAIRKSHSDAPLKAQIFAARRQQQWDEELLNKYGYPGE